ncbi:MAG: hypothetical protein K2M89_03695 [Clostridiales bacterium]|nr:hypothetical protein [Clostridiales bacterium]
MKSFDLQNILNNIIGLHLTDIKHACEMLMFHFDKYAIHARCLTRIIKEDDILLTTADYQSWDGKNDKNNDEWYNIDKYKSSIEGGTVVSVEVNKLCDLYITLDNNVTIQIIIQSGYSHYDEEREQYRFFEIGADDETEEQAQQRKHYVVYNKHIEID